MLQRYLQECFRDTPERFLISFCSSVLTSLSIHLGFFEDSLGILREFFRDSFGILSVDISRWFLGLMSGIYEGFFEEFRRRDSFRILSGFFGDSLRFFKMFRDSLTYRIIIRRSIEPNCDS